MKVSKLKFVVRELLGNGSGVMEVIQDRLSE
jgi:hypothetical protein